MSSQATWGLTLRVVIYRRRVQHETRKNFQLNLFSSDDGHFEYSAVTTNKALGPGALWDFMAGRGAQEKTFAELKGEFALDVVPTNHYGANSAWQQLRVRAHNLLRSFQLDTLASPKPRCRKRTYASSCAACGRCASSSWCAPVASAASATGRCCACPRTLPPRPSTNVWSMPSPRELFSDQG